MSWWRMAVLEAGWVGQMLSDSRGFAECKAVAPHPVGRLTICLLQQALQYGFSTPPVAQPANLIEGPKNFHLRVRAAGGFFLPPNVKAGPRGDKRGLSPEPFRQTQGPEPVEGLAERAKTCPQRRAAPAGPHSRRRSGSSARGFCVAAAG